MTTKRLLMTLISMVLMVSAFAQDMNLGTDTDLVTTEYTDDEIVVDTNGYEIIMPGDVDEFIHPRDYGDDYHNDTLGIFLGSLLLLFVIGVSVALYVVVGIMAKNRHRNVGLWVLLSLIASPLLIIVILLIVGEDYSRR